MIGALVLSILSLASCHYRADGALPDPACTPGAVNPAVTQATIRQTICKRGWATSVRPPLAVTEPEKRKLVKEYGAVFGTSLRGYELDHLIPIELGGAVNDPRNLWPEPHVIPGQLNQGSYEKDRIENELHQAVCFEGMTLARARSWFHPFDWRQA